MIAMSTAGHIHTLANQCTISRKLQLPKISQNFKAFQSEYLTTETKTLDCSADYWDMRVLENSGIDTTADNYKDILKQVNTLPTMQQFYDKS